MTSPARFLSSFVLAGVLVLASVGAVGAAPLACNQVCASHAECEINHICSQVGTEKRCRLATNPTSASCGGTSAATPSPAATPRASAVPENEDLDSTVSAVASPSATPRAATTSGVIESSPTPRTSPTVRTPAPAADEPAISSGFLGENTQLYALLGGGAILLLVAAAVILKLLRRRKARKLAPPAAGGNPIEHPLPPTPMPPPPIDTTHHPMAGMAGASTPSPDFTRQEAEPPSAADVPADSLAATLPGNPYSAPAASHLTLNHPQFRLPAEDAPVGEAVPAAPVESPAFVAPNQTPALTAPTVTEADPQPPATPPADLTPDPTFLPPEPSVAPPQPQEQPPFPTPPAAPPNPAAAPNQAYAAPPRRSTLMQRVSSKGITPPRRGLLQRGAFPATQSQPTRFTPGPQ